MRILPPIVAGLTLIACEPSSTDDPVNPVAETPEPVAEPKVVTEPKEITIAAFDGSGFFEKASSGAIISEDGMTASVSGDFSATPPTGALSGAVYKLDKTGENLVSSSKVLVSVVTKGGPVSVAYSTNEVGNSGWKSFDGSAEWASHEFIFNVPEVVEGRGDFIGIVPVSVESPVEIQSVTITRLN